MLHMKRIACLDCYNLEIVQSELGESCVSCEFENFCDLLAYEDAKSIEERPFFVDNHICVKS